MNTANITTTLENYGYAWHYGALEEDHKFIRIIIIHLQKCTYFRIKSAFFFSVWARKGICMFIYFLFSIFYLCMNKQQIKTALCISRLQQSTINQSNFYFCVTQPEKAYETLIIKLHVWKGKDVKQSWLVTGYFSRI